MELDETTKNASQIMTEMLKQQGKCHDKAADTEMLQLPSSQAHHEDVTDNALNSQESVITYDGGEKNMVMVDKLLVDKVCPVEEMGKENQPERRRSERLKKEMLLTTMEKNEAMAKKRNLEGNPRMPRNLSDVDNSVLNKLAKEMGVVTRNNSFATFDVLKDLESARNCLYSKHQMQTSGPDPVEIVEFNPENDNFVENAITEENSDVEEMMILQSNKNNSSVKKKVKFSSRERKQDQEDFGFKTQGMFAFL